MNKAWLFVLALAMAGGAQAQNYKWIDKDGRTRYGDTPPAGVKATRLGAPASGSGPAAVAPGSAPKDAKKGPLTNAEKEQEFRKRQEAARKDSEKADQERQAKAEREEGCRGTRESLRELESGQRIARTNAAGELYYLEDSQRAQEIAKARQLLNQHCGN
jgi:hypothetical protein